MGGEGNIAIYSNFVYHVSDANIFSSLAILFQRASSFVFVPRKAFSIVRKMHINLYVFSFLWSLAFFTYLFDLPKFIWVSGPE